MQHMHNTTAPARWFLLQKSEPQSRPVFMMSWCSVSSQAKPDCAERIRVWTKAKTALNLHHQLLSWKSLGCSFTCSRREKSIPHADSVDPFFVDTEKPSTESSPNDALEIEVCLASSSEWRGVDLKRPARFLPVMEGGMGERGEESLQ